MTPPDTTTLAAPRFETGRALRIAGLGERYAVDATAGIPGLWQRLHPYLETLPAAVPDFTYGVCGVVDKTGHFDYLAGVEVPTGDLPPDFTAIELAAQRYAVFTHAGHVAAIHRTMNLIWNDWLPRSGHVPAEAPTLERYDAAFDPRTGEGGFEIRLPLRT